VTRRLLRLSEVRQLATARRPVFGAVQRRLAGAHTIWDLRAAAQKRAPRAVFDYVDGAAEEEISLSRARALFASLEFSPSILRNVEQVDVSTDILGTKSSLPFAFAPTGGSFRISV